MKKLIMLTLVITLMVSVSAMAGDTLLIEGSTTVGPIVDAFTEVFKQTYPDLDITVTKNGSGNGAAALIDGRCDIAMMSRFMKETEFKKAVSNSVMPIAHVVAMDGVCVVVHPSNPVKALTIEQLRDIYLAKITNWSQLGGADMPIVVISRDTASGTYETFAQFVMKGNKMAPAVEYVSSNPQAHARIKTTPAAIGYVGLGFLDFNVKALDINGVGPTQQNIVSGNYPISRPLYMFTNGYPELGSMSYKFVTFHLTETGQEIISTKGFVPVTNY